MKVIYLYPTMHNAGGIERVLTVKLNYLADILNYEIILVNYRQRKRNNFFNLSPKIKQIDLELEDPTFLDKKKYSSKELSKINTTFSHILRQKISNILFEENADYTVSAISGKEFNFLYSIKDKSKKILEYHFTYTVSKLYSLKKNANFKSLSGIKNYFYYRKELEKYKSYKNLIVLTEKDKQFWNQELDNVITINNPITLLSEDTSPLTEKKVIALGRLTHQKGYDYLLKIWKKVFYDFPDWTLDIYGDGELKEFLEEEMIKMNLKNVNIYPPSKDVENIYLNSSIFVLPSRFEGLPLVLMESMHYGLPSVAFDCNCGPSDLIDQEQTGFLIPLGDIDSFAEKLAILMSNPKLLTEMGEKAQNKSKKYSLDLVMKTWDNYFKNNSL